MSFYTGRTVFSHGATWNFVPLPIGEYTLGDYLRPHGVRVAVAGKTHMFADEEGFARLGLRRGTEAGLHLAEGGFEPFPLPAVHAFQHSGIDGDQRETFRLHVEECAALPAWLNFNAATGAFSGTPGSGDAGGFDIKVTATDTGSLPAADVFHVSVSALSTNVNPTAAAPAKTTSDLFMLFP